MCYLHTWVLIRHLCDLALGDIPDSTCEEIHMGGILDSTYEDIHIEDAEGQPSDVVVVATQRWVPTGSCRWN
jgi:hypothetical protein